MNITRENVEQLLDAGKIEVAMAHGKWWRIRRNGATKRWKKDASRIRIPYKAGLRNYGTIEDVHFTAMGVLHPDWFRVKEGL